MRSTPPPWIVVEPSLSGLAADCPGGFSSNSQGLYYATNVNAVSLARPYVLIASAVADTWTIVHLWALAIDRHKAADSFLPDQTILQPLWGSVRFEPLGPTPYWIVVAPSAYAAWLSIALDFTLGVPLSSHGFHLPITRQRHSRLMLW